MDYLIYSIEDDKNISQIINKVLTNQGYTIKSFYNAKDFYQEFEKQVPNMILLDMMLPDIMGSEVLKDIRSKSIYDDVVIIIISANTYLIDKLDGLDNGADDYIEKPFEILELMSRVNVHFRKHQKKQIITIQNIKLDVKSHTVFKNDEEVKLTIKEFEILEMLFKNKNNVVKREDILKKLWTTNEIVESRTVDMHIKKLREKLDEESKIIQTIYGIGYKVVG